ncbi:MAG: hypothetical protein HKO57_06495, partial [Akkermansiaceae bacterium]|nr:hypothetical protein [Akkermansiaceae bacterium]
LYRNPVPIKVQFMLSLMADEITPTPRPTRGNPNPDTHKLMLGITPAVTFWNPSNLPLVMNFGDPEKLSYMLRMMNMCLNIEFIKNPGRREERSKKFDMTAITHGGSAGAGGKNNIFSMYISGKNKIMFEPGECRVFSFPYRPNMRYNKNRDEYKEIHEATPGWDASQFLSSNHLSNILSFKEEDRISVRVTPDATGKVYVGNAIQFLMIQKTRQSRTSGETAWHYRHYQVNSRFGSPGVNSEFNFNLMSKGFPEGAGSIAVVPRSGEEIIQRSEGRQPEPWPFLHIGVMAGTETHEDSNGGASGGRRFASRPFLHSTAIAPSFIDDDNHDAFYNYGWNWWVDEINSVFEAPVQISEENQGYYGGGYTPESGSTHVVQQEIPVVPPMSIAALSHAHLGGFSLATEAAGMDYTGLTQSWRTEAFQRVNATGHGGLFPHTLQAIGNSYAHPHLLPQEAYAVWKRRYSADSGEKNVILADHSYLANKALWDEYFFSSISPEPLQVKVLEKSRGRTAKEVAEAFFDGDDSLPNRRMVPYTANLSPDGLDDLFRAPAKFRDGLADRIASHLLVEGPFNVNTTSVEAWKGLLTSLKGKPVAYLDKDSSLSGRLGLGEAVPEGTPVSSFSLPNGPPVEGSTADPSDQGQWVGWRSLTDGEIDQLAAAIVKQVRIRGPFLSLSDFVNRRLDAGDPELAAKGALQAALDDESVSINEGFRAAARTLSDEEIQRMNPKFPEALEGPVAYGSAAYIDQADILRHFAAQLTPRGDTFVIRTYGDSVDAAGRVRGRAWCEAVVQRVPEYLDPADDAHRRHADLTSDINRSFGRTLRVVSFRWLKESEV